MKLTKENILEWKQRLGEEMLKKHGIRDFEHTVDDSEWLSSYEGKDVTKAIFDEEQAWEN